MDFLVEKTQGAKKKKSLRQRQMTQVSPGTRTANTSYQTPQRIDPCKAFYTLPVCTFIRLSNLYRDNTYLQTDLISLQDITRPSHAARPVITC